MCKLKKNMAQIKKKSKMRISENVQNGKNQSRAGNNFQGKEKDGEMEEQNMNDYGKYLKEIWKYIYNIFIKKEQQQKWIKLQPIKL